MNNLQILARLRTLIEIMPKLEGASTTSNVHHEWFARVKATYALYDSYTTLPSTKYCIASPAVYLPDLLEKVHEVIAKLELEVPQTPGSAFPAGSTYDFFKALRELLANAKTDLLIIDPYLDDTVFDAYLSGLKLPVGVRLLANKFAPSLRHAANSYSQQSGIKVEVRQSAKLHDRVIFVDRLEGWVIGQSIKDAAAKKPTYLVALPADATVLKQTEYDSIWSGATVVV